MKVIWSLVAYVAKKYRLQIHQIFAHDAVPPAEDGQVRVHFKAPSKSGATFGQMPPHTCLARLCAWMPPPRFHMARLFGRAGLKARLV